MKNKQECLDLPEEVDNFYKLSFNVDERNFYNEMEEEMLVEFGDETELSAPIVLTQILRLQQITGGFLNNEDGESYIVAETKIKALEMFFSNFNKDQKVVIFARFKDELNEIRRLCKSYGFKYARIDGSVSNPRYQMKKFQTDPEYKIAIVQSQAGAEAITLTAADTSIYYSMTLSWIKYYQARSRVHRAGQTKKVSHIHLLVRNSVDMDILDTLRKKQGWVNVAKKVLKNDEIKLFR